MKSSALVAALAAVMAACAPAPAAEFRQTLALREPLGYTWTDELVHRDVRINEPRAAAATFALADADGKPVPLQVEVLEGKPDAVRRARLWFKATLPQSREVTYRLTYNDEGRAARQAGEGVVVRRADGHFIILNGVFEVMVPSPGKPFEKPVEFPKAPAPVLGIRPGGDSSWYGNWSLAGPARVRELRTTVTASGPVWAEVRLRYVMEDGGQAYEVALKIVRGEPWIDVTERYRLPAGSRMTFTFRDRRRPAEAFWMPWYVGRDGRTQAVYDVQRLRLDDRFKPDVPFAVLRPKWTEMRDSSQLLIALGSGDGGPAIGVVCVAPAEWLRPYEQFVSARVLPEHDGLALDFPLVDGRRRWALVAGRTDRFDTKAELQRLIRKNADIPLDRVLNDWVLQWPRDAANPAPHVLTTWKRFEEFLTEMAEEPDSPVAALIDRVASGERPGDRKVAEILSAMRNESDEAEEARARSAAGPLSAFAATFLDRCYADESLAPIALPRRLAAAMCLADLSAAGRPGGDAHAALLGYVFSDPNYWPDSLNGWEAGHPGTNTDVYTVALYAAAMMPDHPHARRWAAPGLAALREDVRRAVSMPGGAGTECPGATAATWATLLPVMHAVKNAGLDDPFRWPEVRASIECLRNLHTPPDPRLGRRGLAPIGDAAAWQYAAGQVFGLAAAGMRGIDPKLAAAWMSMYGHYHGVDGSGDLARDVLTIGLGQWHMAATKGSDLFAAEGAAWTSQAWPGFGAVLRSNFGGPHETFATFKCGPSRGRYHGDELSFHFFGGGVPVALDFACGAKPRVDQEHMHNRVSLGDNENMDAAGELLTMAASPAGDVAVGQVRSDRLRKMPRYPREGGRETSFPRRTLATETRYRRFIMLVKHPGPSPFEDYLVIRDELASTESATFNLWVLARTVEQEGQAFYFDGQLASDTVAFFASPETDRVKLDRWAWPRQDESSMIPKEFKAGADTWRVGELQQWLRVSAGPGEPFLMVLYPYRKGTTVPMFHSLAGGKGVRVTVDDQSEEAYLATDPAPDAGGQAVVRRQGQPIVILRAGAVPAMGKVPE